MVKVTANGKLRITSIKVEKAVVDPDDLEILEDLVVAGVNKALDEAAQMAQEEMAKVAGLPPGMDMGDLGKMFS
jgi:DNA-binding protein YbaB